MLRIESPRSGALAVGGAESLNLMASEVMQSLRLQEKQQTAAIFAAARAKQEDALRRRVRQQRSAELRESSADVDATGAFAGKTTKKNIVHAIGARGAADSLYTGVMVVAPATGGVTAPAQLPARPVAASKVQTRKTGRHFKTELFFPPV